jgi:hypothetical protein
VAAVGKHVKKWERSSNIQIKTIHKIENKHTKNKKEKPKSSN